MVDTKKTRMDVQLSWLLVEDIHKAQRAPLDRRVDDYLNKILLKMIRDPNYFPNELTIRHRIEGWLGVWNNLKWQQFKKENPLFFSSNLWKSEFQNVMLGINTNMNDFIMDRINTNIELVDEVIRNYTVDLDRFNSLLKPMAHENIYTVLKASVEGGVDLRTGKTFRSVKQVTQGLDKYADNRLRFASMSFMDEYNMQGTLKTWIHHPNKRTRHAGMGGQSCAIDDYFTVYNDITGDIDHFRFPCDVEYDANNCSNICNCQCSVHYDNSAEGVL